MSILPGSGNTLVDALEADWLDEYRERKQKRKEELWELIGEDDD